MRRNAGKRLVMIVSALVVATMSSVVVAAGAGAVNPTITVTTTADILNGSDGVLSLREAVAQANADAGADTIQLASGATYDLTLCGDDTDVSAPNVGIGDLDATDAAGVTLQGPATIHQTCPSRLVESTAGALVLGGLTLTGGRSASGAAVRAEGPLTLDGCSVTGNSVGPTSDPDDGAVAGFGAPVSITNTSISDNQAAGLFKRSMPGTTAADLHVTSSWISRNEVTGARAAGIIALYGVTLESSHVTDNLNHSSPSSAAGGIASLDAQVTLSDVSGNHGSVGGISGGFHLSQSTLVRNVGGLGAGGGRGVFDITRSTVSENSTTFLGGGLEGGGTVIESAVTDNVAFNPTLDEPGTGGGIVVDGGGSLLVRNSTITGNRGQFSAGIFAMDYPAGHPASVQLIASTVAGNVNTPYPGPPQASDLAFATPAGLPPTESPGTLSLEATVLGDNTQAVPACVLQTATVTSTGYNFDADDSCGVGGGVGDIVGGGDPMLAPLAGQGAFTAVRAQLRGSPLTDVIPSGAPQCQAVDQNWRDRPAGSGCDIGASETAGLPIGGGQIVPLAPERIVDTRVGTGGLVPLGTTAQSLVVAGTHGIPAGATAVVLDITGTDVLAPTFVTAYPGGAGPAPNTSTLNLGIGQTAANLAVVQLGAGGAVRFANAHGTINLVVDVVGYVLPESSNDGSMYETTPPTRLADSRDHGALSTFGPHSTQSLVVAGGSSPVPATATAVMVNITATDVSNPSFITAYPKGISRPTASNLNVDRHETRAAAALVKVGDDHSISLFNDSGTLSVVVDVVGYLGGDNRYVGLPPRRLIDTRASGHIGPLHPFGPDEHQSFAVVGDAIPEQVKAVVLNVTVTDSVTGTFVTAYPTPIGPDTTAPSTSSLNVGPHQTNPNLVVVEVGAGGKISLYNKLGSANVVVDLVGYFW